MGKQNEKIKDEALKQLFKLKLEQLNPVRNSFSFRHPIAIEVIWLFSHKFDDMYNDEKMLSILHNAYVDFQTKESREKLIDGMKAWADSNGYAHEQVFN